MNKAYLVLALALSLFLFGCVSDQGTKYVCPDGTTIVTDITKCSAAAAQAPAAGAPAAGAPAAGTAAQIPAAVSQATLDSELAVCSGMPSVQQQSLEDACIIGIAGKYQTTAPCRKVASDKRTTCYIVVAEVKKDPDTCLEAESQADECYAQYARDKKDGAICSKITDINNKDNCYSNLASQLADPEFCNKMKNINQKDSCYSQIAMRLSDSSYCNKIVNSSQKESCQQNLSNTGGGGYPKPPQQVHP